MVGTDALHVTARAWGMWLLVPGLPRRMSLMLGPLCALLVIEPSSGAWSLSALFTKLNVMATLVEVCVGLLVVVPLLVPVWLAEVVGGIIDVSTNLSFASIVNPLAPGASKGVWSTICRELTFGRLVLISLFPHLLAAYVASIRLVAPGTGAITQPLILRVVSEWTGVTDSLLGALVPFLAGCLIIEGFVGIVGRFSAASGVNSLVQLMKFGLGVGFVCTALR